MEMLISIAIAFVAEVPFFSFLGRRMFAAPSSSQFHSMRAYRDFSTKQMLKCRESHIIEAAVVGLSGGLIACYFLGAFFLPVLAAMVALESVWIVMTQEFRPHLRHDYVIKSNLFTGSGAALLIGIALSFALSAAVLPVVIALALFWAAWWLLMPK